MVLKVFLERTVGDNRVFWHYLNGRKRATLQLAARVILHPFPYFLLTLSFSFVVGLDAYKANHAKLFCEKEKP